MIDTGMLRRAFRRLSAEEPRLFRAPGRVNLIGEHTDYNDGFVLPMAIDRGTVVAAAARPDRKVRAYSLNLNQTVEFDLDGPGAGRRGVWLDYVEGVARELEKRGTRLRGADLALDSDVPVGAGLSSSAALEISVGLALASVAGAEIDGVTLALAGQQAEHNYVGTQCGIMDQFVAAMGRRRTALLIDCRTLATIHIPLDSASAAIVICDTRVKHTLANSEYNTRRAECERGVEILKGLLPQEVRALRDVSVEDFERHQVSLPEPVRRRVRHVVTENARTLLAAEALRAGDLEGVGRLMALSHRSLRDDYEVSCRELDTLVRVAETTEGVIGARMTGAGFGGCTVNLVRHGALENFRKTLSLECNRAGQHAPAVYVVESSDGAKEVTTDK
ncbi:MAG TPA: galactokinase [Pyrinomonadaceae bacterium]